MEASMRNGRGENLQREEGKGGEEEEEGNTCWNNGMEEGRKRGEKVD